MYFVCFVHPYFLWLCNIYKKNCILLLFESILIVVWYLISVESERKVSFRQLAKPESVIVTLFNADKNIGHAMRLP